MKSIDSKAKQIHHSKEELQAIVKESRKNIRDANRQLSIYKKRKKQTNELGGWEAYREVKKIIGEGDTRQSVFPKSRNDICAIASKMEWNNVLYTSLYLIWKNEDYQIKIDRILNLKSDPYEFNPVRAWYDVHEMYETEKEIVLDVNLEGLMRINKEKLGLE